ncbi:acyloxyacyl hydrolase [Loktanella sp. S4079]|uniref:acyloxyacyl hydrolase n=1 Tax=Loktanella sp. S4079 TaxID=579483 RepID=UPI0005FA353E|nr:acyloxyacyl hydrolase [Loktanella sp. S4079]KJZ20203.1 hypothetical protein TW80_05050 [Loktanella sp. S4079]
MDGTLALIFLLTSLTDMGSNYCKTGNCLDQQIATDRFAVQAAQVVFQEHETGQEIYFAYDSPRRFGPFQPVIGGSVTDDNDVWLGAGVKWTSTEAFNSPFFLETSLMPGLYARGNGENLGGSLHFRSAIGLGYRFKNDATITLLYDHRSNGDTQSLNPGLETIALRYAFMID